MRLSSLSNVPWGGGVEVSGWCVLGGVWGGGWLVRGVGVLGHGGTHQLLNVGNFRHFFASSPNPELRHASYFCLRVFDALTF